MSAPRAIVGSIVLPEATQVDSRSASSDTFDGDWFAVSSMRIMRSPVTLRPRVA